MHQTNSYLSTLPFKCKDSKFEATLVPPQNEATHGPIRPERHVPANVRHRTYPSLAVDGALPIGRRSGWKMSSTNSASSHVRAEGNIMEPVHALHTCIRHFLSHPDVYGPDVRAVLDRELMYVMRVKASESALLASTTVPVSGVALPAIANTASESNKVGTSFLGKCSNWVVTPRSIDAAVKLDAAFGPNGMFGLGGTKLIDGDAGLFSLLERNRNLLTIQERQPPAEEGEERVATVASTPVNDGDDKNNKADAGRCREKSRVHFSVDRPPGQELVGEPATKLIIDGAGYEISFLRSQLHQVEAAYNAKCIRIHELQQESDRFAAEVKSLEEQNRQQTVRINELGQEVENLTREVDRWKRRANEVSAGERANGGRGPVEQTRRMQASQYVELKREYIHMSQLWRETERSLQETRRNLESAEKENRVSHQYLTDAFAFIERLERRIKRRDDFIGKLKLRQASMEERHEKIMWCLNELQTLRGQHSYVDYLLSESDVWSMFLFSRLHSRFASVTQVEEVTYNTGIPLYFRRTTVGGKFADPYSPRLVYRLVAEHVQGKRKGLPVSNSTFPFIAPRWRGMHSISYFTATGSCRTPGASLMLSGEMTHDQPRHSVPLLTLATVLLPPQVGTTSGEIFIDEDIPNTGQYDQLTIRFLLYCFWGERLTQYKREMESRLEDHANAKEKAAARDIALEMDIDSGANDNDESSPFPGFLAALVDYVRRLCPSKTLRGEEEGAGRLTDPLFVRGVTLNVDGGPSNPRMCFPFIFQRGEHGVEVPVHLSPQARELLFALFYYGEEYKDVDSDFRLFYLIAHQQLPELVGINFYASMEAIRSDCESIVCENLGATTNAREPAFQCEGEKPEQERGKNLPEILLTDSPAETLRKVAVIVDEAPLDEEDTCMEADSEGEGYGVILPGISEEKEAAPGQQEATDGSNTYSLAKLKHDILSCINKRNSKSGEGMADAIELIPKVEDGTEAAAAPCVPKNWNRLDEQLQSILAPHTSLLNTFKKCKESRSLGDHRREKNKTHRSSMVLPSSRSLITVEAFISLLHKHCFATYALSCSGSASSSLLDSVLKAVDNEGGAKEMDPLTRIGQLPPMSKHIRRLRFAVALDQPSSLLRYMDLFSVDPRFGTPSHFHHEYLRLTIDTYLEQQEAYMNVIFGSCVARDGRAIPAPVVDADGILPFPALRAGFEATLRKLSLDPKESNIVAKHFLNYCDLLRHEDDIRQEQFADAPLLINAEVVSRKDFARDSALLREQGWSVEDEAASCSLIHLSFAARMMYIVWGLTLSSKARLAVAMLPGVARNFANAGCTLGGQSAPSESSDSVDGACALREEFDPLFRFEVEEDCREALNRAKIGCGLHNELRQLLAEVSPEPSPGRIADPSATTSDFRGADTTEPGDMLVDIDCLFLLFGAKTRPGAHSWQGDAVSTCSRKTNRSVKRLSPRPSSCETDVAAGGVYLSVGNSLLRFFCNRRTGRTRGDKRKLSRGRRNSQEVPAAVFSQIVRYENTPVLQGSVLETLATLGNEANASMKRVAEYATATGFIQNDADGHPNSELLRQVGEAGAGRASWLASGPYSLSLRAKDANQAVVEGGERRPYSPLVMSSSDKSDQGNAEPVLSQLAKRLHVASAVLSLL